MYSRICNVYSPKAEKKLNKLWLLIATRDNKIELKQIDFIQENTKKYELKHEYPFEEYNYIHKHNLNIVQYENKTKAHYVVALSKKECINGYENFIHQKVDRYMKNVNKLIDLKEKLLEL